VRDQIKEDEMSGAHGTYRGNDKYVQDFWCGILKDRGHLEVLNIDGIIMSRWILKE
jgi:hypothetical protein